LVVLAVLLVLIALAPLALSTPTGNRMIFNVVNDRLAGDVQVDKLTLSWLGPIRVVNLRVHDTDGREALSVADVTCQFGLWGALTHPQRFETVTVNKPTVTLYLDEDGKPSLADALRPPEEEPAPPADEKPKAPPDEPAPPEPLELPPIAPHGDLVISEAIISIVQPDGRTYTVKRLDANVTLQAFQHLIGTGSVELTDGGKASLEFDLSDLVDGTTLDLNKAHGHVTASTTEPIALGPLLRLANVAQTIDGNLTFNGTATLKGGQAVAEFRLETSQLRETSPDAPARPPLDFAVVGSAMVGTQQGDGEVTLASDAANGTVAFDYDLSSGSFPAALDDLLDLLPGGQPIDWPHVALTINGKADLVKIAQAAPSLLKLLPDVTLQSGQFIADNIALRGGSAPSFTGRAAIQNVSATHDGRQVRIRPIEFVADAGLTEKAGLNVRRMDIETSFGQLKATATHASARVTLDADLSSLQGELGQIVDFGGYEVDGVIQELALLLRRAEDDTVGIQAKAYGNRLKLTTPRGVIDLGEAGVVLQQALLRIDQKRLAECSAKRLHVTSSLGTLEASGKYRAADGHITANADVQDVRLAKVTQAITALIDVDLPTVNGTAAGQLNASRTGDGPADVTAKLQVESLVLQDKGDGVRWPTATASFEAQVAFDKDNQPTAIDLRSGEFELPETAIGLASGQYDLTTGALEANAKLAVVDAGRVRAMLREFMPDDKAVAVDGSLKLTASVTREDADAPLVSSGEAVVSALRVDNKPLTREPSRFAWTDVSVNPAEAALAAGVLTVESELLTAKAGALAFDADSHRFEGTGRLTADLGGCLTAARAFLPGLSLPDVAGELTAQASAEPHGKGRIISDGQAELRGLRIDDRIVLADPSSAKWRKLVIDPKALVFSFSSLALASEIFSLDAKSIAADPNELEFSGDCDMTADLAGCVAAARALQITPDNWPKDKPWPLLPDVTLPDIAGTLTAKASFAPGKSGKTIASGAARVDGLAVDGKRLFDKPGEAAWEGLALDAKAKAFALKRLSVSSEVLTASADRLSVATAEELRLAGTGSLKADLAGCVAIARSFLPEKGLPNLAGTLTAGASAAPGKGGKIISDGKARLEGLRVDDAPLLDGPANVQWQTVTIDPKEKTFSVANASVASSVLTFSAEEVDVNPADLQITGEGSLDADLAGCLAIVRAFQEDVDLPDITGRLTWAGKARTKGDLVDITGQGRATDLLLRRKEEGGEEEGGKELSLPLTTLDHDLTLDRKADRLSLRTFALDSKLLSAELTGTVAELRTRQVFDLRGKYDCAWDQVNLLIEQFAPDAGEMVTVTGRTSGPFVATGPANEPDLKPVFRKLEATGSVGWQTAEVLGISFEAATVRPAFKDGRLTIPNTSVAAKEGKALIAGVVDFEPESPTYRLAGKNLLLDRLKVDKKVLQQFLSRFNPVFSDVASAEGFVSLETVDLELPLSDEINRGGSGTGHLDLTEMTVRPGGLLLALLRLGGGVDPKQDTRMTVGRVAFEIKEGRIHYDNFTLTFPTMANFDPTFYGSVGFNGDMDLVCSVPVRAELLEKLKVTGPVLDYARLLEGTRVGIPVAGTREKPKLDFSQVNIQPLVQKALEKLLKEQVEEQLGDEIRDRLKDLFK
jgi:hypothetical protein